MPQEHAAADGRDPQAAGGIEVKGGHVLAAGAFGVVLVERHPLDGAVVDPVQADLRSDPERAVGILGQRVNAFVAEARFPADLGPETVERRAARGETAQPARVRSEPERSATVLVDRADRRVADGFRVVRVRGDAAGRVTIEQVQPFAAAHPEQAAAIAKQRRDDIGRDACRFADSLEHEGVARPVLVGERRGRDQAGERQSRQPSGDGFSGQKSPRRNRPRASAGVRAGCRRSRRCAR